VTFNIEIILTVFSKTLAHTIVTKYLKISFWVLLNMSTMVIPTGKITFIDVKDLNRKRIARLVNKRKHPLTEFKISPTGIVFTKFVFGSEDIGRLMQEINSLISSTKGTMTGQLIVKEYTIGVSRLLYVKCIGKNIHVVRSRQYHNTPTNVVGSIMQTLSPTEFFIDLAVGGDALVEAENVCRIPECELHLSKYMPSDLLSVITAYGVF
jgi:hypothetical protein